MSAPRFHRLKVADVRRETADAVSIAFAVPPEIEAEFDYACGQYLTLKTDIDGEEVRRSYSICSGRDDGELRVAVKRVDGGLFSSFANDGVARGDEVEVMTPLGRFTPRAPVTPGSRTLVGFAAGSGITPILSIIKTVLVREPGSRFFLFYGNRATTSILFRETLETLKDQCLDRLSIFHVLSRETQDVEVLNGRLDRQKVELLLRAVVPVEAIDEAFVCGPATMIDEIEATLGGLGLPAEKIHIERFTPAPVGPRPRAPRKVEPREAPAAFATIITDGAATVVPVAADEAILDAALRAGLDLPFSCRGGMCCTCRAKVADGAVEMAVNYSLEKWELDAGFVLTCQSRPTTAKVTIDFDQV